MIDRLRKTTERFAESSQYGFLFKLMALALAIALVVLGAGVAFADDLNNQLDASLDADRETVNLAPGGAIQVVTLKLQSNHPSSPDGDANCNIDGTEQLVLAATSSNPGVATVTPTVTFNQCNERSVTVTSVASGQADITFSISSNNTGGGTYDLTGGNFKVEVASANTQPSVAVTGVTHGSSYEIGDVPTPGCSVTDAQDGLNASTSAAVAVVTGTLSHGLGSQTATCSYTDLGGLTGSASATYSIVDTGDPTITHSIDISPAASGWYTSAPTVTFNCSDIGGSGIQSCVVDGSDPASASVTLGEGADQSVSGTATDWANNTAQDTASNLDVDTVPPSVSVTGLVDGTTFTLGQTLPIPGCDASDATSLLDSSETDTTPTQSGTLGINGTGTLTFTCGATDNAGHTNSASKSYSIEYGGDATTGFKILQPINSDNTSVFSRGKVVPVKFKLAGDEPAGFNVTGWSIERQRVNCESMADEGLAPEAVAASNPAGLRYDSGADQYIQNSDFRSAAVGTCWRVRGVLDNGQTTDWSGAFKISK